MTQRLHVVVTGAQGFVGQALVKRLLADGLDGRAVTRLTLMDLRFEGQDTDDRVFRVAGSIADPAVRAMAWSEPVHAVFHLASLPGGAAQKDYALGRAINLDATIGLLEDLSRRPGDTPAPRFVFASTIAVYGDPLPPAMSEHALPAPALTYGAHKLAGEVLVADATRRGWVQGCSLRLPGVVARPGEGTGMLSAFMSQVFWKLAAGRPIVLPVSPEGVAWWISVGACVDNLLLAATVDPARLNPARSYQMPVLRLTLRELVEALVARFGADRRELVRYEPDAFIQKLFASYPPLATPEAEALGLKADASVDDLITRALAQ